MFSLVRRLCGWLSLVLLVSCGPPGTVTPSAATVNDVIGWWFHVDPGPEGGTRVYGLVPPPDGPWSVPVNFSHREKPISTILYAGSPQIRASFEVKDGAIVETVIDSVDFDPGKQFSTKILSLVKGQSMSLESKNAPGGVRPYTWHERCPLTIASGWSVTATLNYPSYFATASTLAFDSKGRLHSFTGMAGEQNGAFPARPTYSVLDKGCEAIWFTASNARQASLVVDASDVVHLFWTESGVYSEGPDSTLMHKYRQTDSEQWTTETLSTLQAQRVLKAVSRGQRTVLVTQRISASAMPRSIELFESREGTWSSTFATVNGTNVLGSLNGAGLDPSGRLWISLHNSSLSNRGSLLREVSAGVFEALTTPAAPLQLLGDFYVDAAGRAHQIIISGPDGAQHGIFENETWRFLRAPSAEGFVPVDAPPWKHFVVTDTAFPFLVLATQRDDGVSSYEFVSGRTYNPNTATSRGVAVGRDGTIAVAETGEVVSLKRPVAPWGQVETVPVTITIGGSGAGRVWSEDGRIDCSATCTLDLPVYSRHRVRADAAPQNVHVKGGTESDGMGAWFAWLDIAPVPSSVFGMRTSNTFAFEFARSVTPVVIPLSPATGPLGTITDWDARGASIAVSYGSNAGKVFFRDTEFTAPGSGAGEVLLLAAGGATPVVRRLPAAPTRVGVLTEGGARGLFFANRALTFEGTTLGASAAPVVVHVTWDAALAQTDVQTLITLPANSVMTASALDPVGNAAVLVQNGVGFPSLGTNVKTALIWRSSSGLVMVVPFEANVLIPSPKVSVRGATLFISSGSNLWVFADGVRAGSSTLAGGEVGPGSPTSTGALSIATATSGVDLSGGGNPNPMSGDQYLMSWGFDGAPMTTTVLRPPFNRIVAVGAEPRGMLVLDQPTTAGPYLFLAGQNRAEPLVRNPTQVRALSAQVDGDGMWVLVQQQVASVDYGTATVPGAGGQVLVKAVLP